MVIGKGGVEIEKYKAELEKMVKMPVSLNVIEVRQPDLDAQLVAENVCLQLEKRTSFRRAMKMAIRNTMRLGAKGIKIMVSGRLGGAEIARSEHYHEGTIPLQTLRADIDYGFWEANTTYGKIGVKVWIYKGEILNEVNRTSVAAPRDNRGERRDRRDGNRDQRGDRRNGDRRGGNRGDRTPREGGRK
jgi:small subunit ribosomal protein S3